MMAVATFQATNALVARHRFPNTNTHVGIEVNENKY